ncbi:MAG TPA: SGNH/GDSL hydrolase family protein [Polyangiales bacterium]|nr:SGNH/GDSL hydrolase family protein [Polyangiales bacterium]
MQALYVLASVERLPDAGGEKSGRAGTGDRTLSIAVVGESPVAGVGVSDHRDGLSCQLAHRLATHYACEVTWQALGLTGATLSRIRRKLVDEVRGTPDVAVVICGVNDSLFLTAESRFGKEVRRTHAALLARGAKHIVFSAVPPVGDFPALPRLMARTIGLRASLLDAQLRHELTTLDHSSYAPMGPLNTGENMASDGFHPSHQGYALWATRLTDHITTTLS